MGSLGCWTVIAVLYQTTFCVIISWLILGCKLPPNDAELHEITLMKLLYLYDPEACGRIYFYNFTKSRPFPSSNIVWPVKNDIASGFRKRIRIWLALHLIWTILGAVYITQGQRPCGFYVALLPFTITGVAILVMDLVYAGLFLTDIKMTGTEAAIFDYIKTDSENVRMINKTIHQVDQSVTMTSSDSEEDTSWIALLLAYISCRAVVQWLVNFWIVKDNYYCGVEYYRLLRKYREKSRSQYDRRNITL